MFVLSLVKRKKIRGLLRGFFIKHQMRIEMSVGGGVKKAKWRGSNPCVDRKNNI